jgi:hypothetical protein
MKILLISLTILFALSSSVFAESQRRHGKYYNKHDNSGRYSSHYGKHQEKPHYYNKPSRHYGHHYRPQIYYTSRPSRHHNNHLPAIIIGAGVLGYILGAGH